jgi:hypothetical protein
MNRCKIQALQPEDDGFSSRDEPLPIMKKYQNNAIHGREYARTVIFISRGRRSRHG